MAYTDTLCNKMNIYVLVNYLIIDLLVEMEKISKSLKI